MNILPGTMHEQIWKDDEEESEISSEAARDEEEYYDSEEGDDEEDDIIIDAAAELSGYQWDDDSEEKCNIENDVKLKSKKKSAREEINDLNDRLNLNDPNSTPQPNELMNQFFSRTAKYWMALDIENHEMEKAAAPAAAPRGGEEFSEKEVRRRAFKLAEVRYMELQPILERLDKLEKQQRELEEARVNNRDIDSQRRRRMKDGRKKA